MPTANVTVAFVNPPKPGKKMGSIKTRDGTYYGVWPNDLPSFKQNGIYEIEFEERDNFKSVKRVVSENGVARPMGRGFGGGPRVTSPVDAERMFTCGAINAAVGAGRLELNVTDLVPAVNALREAWAETFGKDAPAP